jgi:hypothetical protein
MAHKALTNLPAYVTVDRQVEGMTLRALEGITV